MCYRFGSESFDLCLRLSLSAHTRVYLRTGRAAGDVAAVRARAPPCRAVCWYGMDVLRYKPTSYEITATPPAPMRAYVALHTSKTHRQPICINSFLGVSEFHPVSLAGPHRATRSCEHGARRGEQPLFFWCLLGPVLPVPLWVGRLKAAAARLLGKPFWWVVFERDLRSTAARPDVRPGRARAARNVQAVAAEHRSGAHSAPRVSPRRRRGRSRSTRRPLRRAANAANAAPALPPPLLPCASTALTLLVGGGGGLTGSRRSCSLETACGGGWASSLAGQCSCRRTARSGGPSGRCRKTFETFY